MPHEKRDKWGRIVPPMPSAPVDPSSLYTSKSTFLISPHPTRPLRAASINNLPLSIQVQRRIEPLGNMAAQRFVCTVITGPECLKDRHLFAIAYDPLFVPVEALPVDNSGDSPSLTANRQNKEPCRKRTNHEPQQENHCQLQL